MFTPNLGKISVQIGSASPGAWAQLHLDNKLNTSAIARRHPIFTLANEFFFGLILGQIPAGKNTDINWMWSPDELWTDLRPGIYLQELVLDTKSRLNQFLSNQAC